MLPESATMALRASAECFTADGARRDSNSSNRGAGCAQSPFCPAAPARRSSRISPTRRNRMGPSWCARGRSAYAGPIAKSSMGVMALPLPVSSASFSAMNRWARWKRRPRGAGLRLAISSSGSCAGPILCRASRAPPASGTCAATAATPNAGSRSGTATAPNASVSSRSLRSGSTRRWHSRRVAGAR